MVTTSSPVKSSRPARSPSENWLATCRASARAASGNVSGNPNARMTESVSTPSLPCAPRTSVITPSPRSSREGNRSISMTTLSCRFAPFAPGSPTEMLCENTVPSTRTSRLAIAFEVGADECSRRPLQHANDLSSRVLDSRGLTRDANHYPSPVAASRALSSRTNTSGLKKAIDCERADEAVTGLRAAEDARKRAARIDRAKRVVAAQRQSAGSDEFAHAPAELGVVLLSEVESLVKGLGLDRRIALGGDGMENTRQQIGHETFSLRND